MTSNLFVPYGLSVTGDLVHADDAVPGTAYVCPGCASPLILKAGQIVTAHFAHAADTACDGETLLHKTAKMLLMMVIREQIKKPKKATRITLGCSCDRCKTSIVKVLSPYVFSSVAEEDAVGRYVCDVVAYRWEEQSLAIEVRATHSVDRLKGNELSIPWIELSAESVLADPYKWRPERSRLKPVLCGECKSFLVRLREVAEKCDQPLTEYAGYRDTTRAKYLAAIRRCAGRDCGTEFISYWWMGVPFCNFTPPEPTPWTIRRRFSSAFKGEYWANCCPKCQMIDGDNYLFLDLDGNSPFVGLPMRTAALPKHHQAQANSAVVRAFLRHI
jgi:ssDNA-binding Zn-finger/Zn-ribbon topoisomerase 1